MHIFTRNIERFDHDQRAVVNSILHRADGRLCVIAAMQIVTHADFEHHTFKRHR